MPVHVLRFAVVFAVISLWCAPAADAGTNAAIAADAANPAMLQSLLSAYGPAGAPEMVRIEAVIHDAAGLPVANAVLFTDAGGSAITDAGGRAVLDVTISRGTEVLYLSAAGTSAGSNLLGNRRLSLAEHWRACGAGTNTIDVGILMMQANTECEAQWVPAFGSLPDVNNVIWALTVFDDGSGSGPALYAGGMFTTAGGVTINRIARWDGSYWSALGSGMNNTVYALTVFDDGSGGGPALYAGGAVHDRRRGGREPDRAVGRQQLVSAGQWDERLGPCPGRL